MSTLKNSWSKFLAYEGSSKYIFGMIFTLILTSLLGASLPIYMSRLSTHYAQKELFLQTLKILSVIFIATFVNRSTYNIIINKYVVGLVHYVRSYCYSKWLLSYDIQTSSENKIDRYPQGEVLARIMSDTEALRELVTSGTFGILIDLFFVFSSLASFISLNQISGIGLALIQVFACAVLIWGSKYMRDVFMKVRLARADLYKTMADIIGGTKENYYVENHQYASKKSVGVFEEFLTRILQSNVWDASYYSLAESLFPIFLAFAVVIIPYSKITEVGLIFALVDLIQRSIGPIKDVSSKIANIQRAASGITRINEFIDDLDHARATNLEAADFNLDFSEFHANIEKFEYKKHGGNESVFTLRNIEFSAKKGELIGIVGMSGSGKSTLLNILCANILPDIGSIKLSGNLEKFEFNFHDVEKFSKYRQLIGIVSQDSHIFTQSVLYNITMGKEENLSENFSEFWAQVEKNITYIKTWGIGPETILEQNKLSLGQKQLIAAIRACYLKKPIVLFDEISSSLDSNLELALRQMVLLVQKNALTIIVAHRLETIINSDKILVIDSGTKVSEGSHEFLLKESDIYCQFIAKLSN